MPAFTAGIFFNRVLNLYIVFGTLCFRQRQLSGRLPITILKKSIMTFRRYLLTILALLPASFLLSCTDAGQSTGLNKDAIIADLTSLGADAYQFKVLPQAMGGGNGTYEGYRIAPNGAWGSANPNATYSVTTQTASELVLTATSKQINGATVTETFDGKGVVTSGPTASGF